jgi:uncharacterized protein YcbX
MLSKDILSHPFLTKDTAEYIAGSTRVEGIVYFPGKSMAPHYLSEAYIDNVGIRPGEKDPTSDRQFMLTNPDGRMESQRSLPEMARLQISVNGDAVTLEFDGDALTFEISTETEISVRVHTVDGIAAVDQGEQVAEWLQSKFGKDLRLVRQVDSQPRERDDEIPQLEGIRKILRLQDSSPITGLSHASLHLLNERLAEHQWHMEALSFRMNLLFAGNFNEHEAVGKYLRFGEGDTAVYVYVWRPKERCPMPSVDPERGFFRGNEGAPKDRMSYVYQTILKEIEMHDALAIPENWRSVPKKSGDGTVPKAMIGIDMFPITRGVIRIGDPIAVLEELPDHIMASL